MPYADVDALLIDVASHYDDTDAVQHGIPASKQARYLHYVQRTVDEIANYKPWPWKMTYASLQFNITPVNGRECVVPADFANVGPNGALFDPTGRPWTEIDFRNMVSIIASGKLQHMQYFCVGRRLESGTSGVGDGGVLGAEERGILIPDPNRTDIFTLFYETSPPLVQIGQPIPLPESMHEALLMGTVAKLQEGKGDPRETWVREYRDALARQIAVQMPLSSRVQQMPMTTGRRMW